MEDTKIYKVEIQQKLCLVLDIIRYMKGMYFNTNDLVKIAEKYKSAEVRLRQDKSDYIYYDDTRAGGLRGNFSNILTDLGLFKKGERITSYFGVGYKNRISNAIYSGKIILKKENKKYYALTKDKNLADSIELENKLYLIKEQQSHIKSYIKDRNIEYLKRDKRFKKISVVKTETNILFLRAKINNFKSKEILEYKLIPYWEGSKLKINNIHLMIVLPGNKDGWGDSFAIQFKKLFKHKPLFLFINIQSKECVDELDNQYELIPLEIAISTFEKEDENEIERLNYDWKILKEASWERTRISQENDHFQKDEFNLFLDKFLNWDKSFKVSNHQVVDISVSSSGGADVRLEFAGGTKQKLELEHQWKNYLLHGHHLNSNWENTWLWANEILDYRKIKNIFLKHSKAENKSRIPTHFLGTDKDNKRKLLIVDWEDESFKEIDVI